LKRHAADRQTNNDKRATVVTSSGDTPTAWKDIKVGTILKLSDREEVPADLILLQCSDPAGKAYVETSNIDGETNLKLRQSIIPLYACDDWSTVRGDVIYENPNSNIHKFEGSFSLVGLEKLPLDNNNLLLRGCTIRNTKFLYGLVVFTGKETKVMQKAGAKLGKFSNVEKIVNKCLSIVFFTQAALCTISVFGVIAWDSMYEAFLPYMSSDKVSSREMVIPQFIGDWITFLILFNNFVPISLYVTMEMVHYVQASYINNDNEMYHDETNTPAKALTSNLNEDLGQIEYIFSDKTGTLTRNEMIFKMCSIGGVKYGSYIAESRSKRAAENSGTERENPMHTKANAALESVNEEKEALSSSPTVVNMPCSHDMQMRAVKNGFDDMSLARDADRSRPNSQTITDFFSVLSLCHTVVTENGPDGELVYQAQSPDEGALVNAARDLGFVYTGFDNGFLVLKLGSSTKRFKLHAVNEFDSTRKRQSSLIEDENGNFILYIKGADNVIMDRVKSGQNFTTLNEHLTEFAKLGLRTLVLAKRMVPASEAKEWIRSFKDAANSIDKREEKLAAIAEKLEVNLEVVGATAIEDRLQKGVPETIEVLAEAGIKLWVLTGDKMETAINIGRSAQLLVDGMVMIKFESSNADVLNEQMDKNISEFLTVGKSTFWSSAVNKMKDPLGKKKIKFKLKDLKSSLAVVVDGTSLITIFDNAKLQSKFLEICKIVRVVIACRVSPKQKADIVRMVKRGVHPRPMTLAIGDGANDVGMIKEADVGIGISGHEGLQAVNASDFAIAQFRFLQKLLLIHGRWNYRRMSKVVLYSFYKNIVFTLTCFFYSFCTGFSGTSLYDDLVMSGFNFFLGWPIVGVGWFDRDISQRKCEEQPQVYCSGMMNLNLNRLKMAQWIFSAILHAIIIIGIPLAFEVVGTSAWSLNGATTDKELFGITVYSLMIVALNAKVATTTFTWTWISFVQFIILSNGLYLMFLFVYNTWLESSPSFYGTVDMMFASPVFWVLMVLVPSCVVMVDTIAEYWRLEFFPDAIDVCIERDHGFLTKKELASKKPGSKRWVASQPKTDDDPTASELDSAPTLRKVLSHIPKESMRELGLQSIGDEEEARKSGFSYDHVTSSYGQGAGRFLGTIKLPNLQIPKNPLKSPFKAGGAFAPSSPKLDGSNGSVELSSRKL
jgi:phospholipid-transporting ATPase